MRVALTAGSALFLLRLGLDEYFKALTVGLAQSLAPVEHLAALADLLRATPPGCMGTKNHSGQESCNRFWCLVVCIFPSLRQGVIENYFNFNLQFDQHVRAKHYFLLLLYGYVEVRRCVVLREDNVQDSFVNG